ncbi:MAG: tripartite tricarboxylate transporter substrate binding protein [Betaproteobacteria bacterium]|nr:tripartite tricarboxylate transporter substrate binding protein [Betaproteobacteria bacterium]
MKIGNLLPRQLCIVFSLVMCASIAGAASAQGYPNKPIRIIVPATPGSGNDIVTRLFTPSLTDAMGQAFVVDNRAGAATNIGAEAVARAAPDGYTLLSASVATTINQTLYKKLSFDVVRDFEPIALLASVPFVLVVHPSLPVRSIRELIAFVRARPGQLNFASVGIGSFNHLTTELLKMRAGVDVFHVPYKGSPPALTDLIGGEVSMMFANTLSVLPHVKAGRLRALAITGARRSAAAPELPTVAESGLPGFESGTWFALLAPAGTPREIVTRLNAEATKAGQSPEIRERLAAQGAEPLGGTPAQAGAFIKSEIAKWGKVVVVSGARVE